jgi:Holliday junction resolvase RusA-like endonuclease
LSQGALFAPDESPLLQFTVAGTPVGQGSKIALISGKRKKVVEGKGQFAKTVIWVRNPIASLIESANRKNSKGEKNRLEAWRRLVIGRATLAIPDDHQLFEFAVIMTCEFIFPRKESHFKKNGGGLMSSAPLIPGHDLDKYYRAIGDSLSGVVYKDDRQITRMGDTRKRFGSVNGGGVRITIWRDYECG